MSSDEEDFEWELCKENILPCRKGRNVKQTNEALRNLSSGKLSKTTALPRMQWELKLRLPHPDPLSVHYGYLDWIEQNYPQGGKESGYAQILELSVKKFLNETRYFNDPRYVNIWLSFIKEISNEALLFFKALFLRGIGTMVARFYFEWTIHLEVEQQLSYACEVYEHGIFAGAQPKDWLQGNYNLFKERHAAVLLKLSPNSKSILIHDPLVDDANPESLNTEADADNEALEAKGKIRRKALADLRSNSNSLASIPVLRTGIAIDTSAKGPIKPTTNVTRDKNTMGPSFQVFSDKALAKPVKPANRVTAMTGGGAVDSSGSSSSGLAAVMLSSLTQVKQQRKENIIPATCWNEGKAVIPTEETSNVPSTGPKFTVFRDPKPDEHSEPVVKMKPPKPSLVLRKPGKTKDRMKLDPESSDALRRSKFKLLADVRSKGSDQNPTEECLPCLPEPVPEGWHFMTSLKLIYGGTTPVSIEMVKAEKWFQNQS